MKKVIGILILTLTTTIFAQDSSQKVSPQPSVIVESVTLQVSHASQLSEEQKAELKEVVEEFERSQSLLQLDMREVNLKIEKEMLQDKPSLKAINSLIDKKSRIINQLEKNVFETKFKIDEILS